MIISESKPKRVTEEDEHYISMFPDGNSGIIARNYYWTLREIGDSPSKAAEKVFLACIPEALRKTK